MRFSILSVVLAVASIAQYAGANPMRVVIIAGNQDLSSNIRLGHPAVGNINQPVSVPGKVISPTEINEAGPQSIGAGRRPCHTAGRIKDRLERISDIFRQALGFSPIETKNAASGQPFVHFLPYFGPPHGPHGPNPPTEETEPGRGHHGHHRHHHHHHRRPFLKRIHFALMALGPWEGRAVAFVLGCGIGVLLRMFWVMTLLTLRLYRGRRAEEPQYIAVICDHYDDAEEAVVPPPPQYIIDEKVGVEPKKRADEA